LERYNRKLNDNLAVHGNILPLIEFLKEEHKFYRSEILAARDGDIPRIENTLELLEDPILEEIFEKVKNRLEKDVGFRRENLILATEFIIDEDLKGFTKVYHDVNGFDSVKLSKPAEVLFFELRLDVRCLSSEKENAKVKELISQLQRAQIAHSIIPAFAELVRIGNRNKCCDIVMSHFMTRKEVEALFDHLTNLKDGKDNFGSAIRMMNKTQKERPEVKENTTTTPSRDSFLGESYNSITSRDSSQIQDSHKETWPKEILDLCAKISKQREMKDEDRKTIDQIRKTYGLSREQLATTFARILKNDVDIRILQHMLQFYFDESPSVKEK